MQTPQNTLLKELSSKALSPTDSPSTAHPVPGNLAPDRYNVTGLVVYIRPEQTQAVTEQLHSIRGVEVHEPEASQQTAKGKLVVTVEEEPGETTMVDAITQINNTPGVISVSLVYCQTDLNENARLDSEKTQ